MGAPRLVLFTTKTDPMSRERLGGFLGDGHLVDLQSAHVAMHGHPSPYLRDRTAFAFGREPALATVVDVLAWVDSQRPPGVMVPERNANVLAPLSP